LPDLSPKEAAVPPHAVYRRQEGFGGFGNEKVPVMNRIVRGRYPDSHAEEQGRKKGRQLYPGEPVSVQIELDILIYKNRPKSPVKNFLPFPLILYFQEENRAWIAFHAKDREF
jgi:hypothetical protein